MEHLHCDHDHHHNHHDHHEIPSQKAFILGIVLNLGFTLIEFIYGFIANSVALMADAGHNLSDVLGLVIAYVASRLVLKKASSRFTFGLKASTILSALINSTFLFLAVGMILYEAILRLNNQVEVQTNLMMIIAGIGIVVNFVTAMFFHSHAHHDLNAKGAYLHLLGDAFISLGVVIAGLLIKYTGLNIIDPIVSIAISLFIIYGTWSIFKEALYLSINSVPEKINIEELEKYLMSMKGVSSIHDLHVWAMSTTENALTVHLVIPEEKTHDQLLKEIKTNLKNQFQIQHSTIQIEKNNECEMLDQNCYHAKN